MRNFFNKNNKLYENPGFFQNVIYCTVNGVNEAYTAGLIHQRIAHVDHDLRWR
jgi:hypothetical protein